MWMFVLHCCMGDSLCLWQRNANVCASLYCTRESLSFPSSSPPTMRCNDHDGLHCDIFLPSTPSHPGPLWLGACVVYIGSEEISYTPSSYAECWVHSVVGLSEKIIQIFCDFMLERDALLYCHWFHYAVLWGVFFFFWIGNINYVDNIHGRIIALNLFDLMHMYTKPGLWLVCVTDACMREREREFYMPGKVWTLHA